MATSTEVTPAREPGPGQAPVLVMTPPKAGADRGAVARRLFGAPGDVPSKIFDQDTIV